MKQGAISRNRRTWISCREEEGSGRKAYRAPNPAEYNVSFFWNGRQDSWPQCPPQLTVAVTVCEGVWAWGGGVKGLRWHKWIQWGRPSNLAAVESYKNYFEGAPPLRGKGWGWSGGERSWSDFWCWLEMDKRWYAVEVGCSQWISTGGSGGDKVGT